MVAGAKAVVLVAMAAGLAAQAPAQDVFSLPPGTASPTARPAGPVDSDSPVIRPRPAASAPAQPATTAAASPAPSATPSPARSRAATRAISTGAAQQQPSAPTPRAQPVSPADAATTVPAVTATAEPASAASAPEPAPDPAGSSDWAAFATGALVGALALLALVGGLIWRRRQPGSAAAIAFEPPVVPAAPPEPIEPAPVPAPEPAPEPAAPAPAPEPAAAPAGLEIALEARRIDASLMATTLAYTVRLTNHGPAPLTAVEVGADMIAAHSSLPVEQQIAKPADQLERRHQLAALAPGDSAELRGEIRLPLAAITPIRAGDAAYFVPLARVKVAAAQPGDEPLVIARTFVVGELPDQPGAALRPLRMDLGPRTFGKLGQRAVG